MNAKAKETKKKVIHRKVAIATKPRVVIQDCEFHGSPNAETLAVALEIARALGALVGVIRPAPILTITGE